MRYEKIMKILNAAISDLRAVYAQAETACMPCMQLIDYVAAIRSRLAACPVWAKERFTGYDRALWDMHEKHVVFGGYVDSTFYVTESSHPLYYVKLGLDPVDVARAPAATKKHYYRTSIARGKPMQY